MLRIPAIVFLLLLLPLSASAQHGTVRYEHTEAINFELPDHIMEMKFDGIEEALEKVPKQRTVEHELVFNSAASLLTVLESEQPLADEATFNLKPEPGIELAFKIGPSGSATRESVAATYMDFEKGTFSEERTFMGRTFLISGEPETLSWKLPGDEAIVLDYHVLKATATKDSTTIEAWYAPEIPIAAGPGRYGGLPGLILLLSINDGEEIYTAVEIDLEAAPEVIPPSKGRKVTQERYDEIKVEKLKELEQQQPRIVIKTGDRVRSSH